MRKPLCRFSTGGQTVAIGLFLLVGLFLFAAQANAQGSHITSVDRPSAKAGDVERATGEGLGQSAVDELYLTNDSQDVKVNIIEQGEKLITFKIPADIKPGRWALMIHLKAATGTKFL